MARWELLVTGYLALLFALTASTASCAPLTLADDWGNLDGEWLFSTDPGDVGEKEGWHRPDFRDSGWRTLHAPGYWEEQGVTDPRPGQPPKPKDGLRYTDYDGVAWYRLHFVVPASWAGGDLDLALGSVDDQDRTYLNGHLVGETGPGLQQPSTVSRWYVVPAKTINFGGENVLAVRVFDNGGPGGIVGPTLSLLPRRTAEADMKLPQEDRPLAERFAKPPAARRILKIIHSWPDAPEAQDNLIKMLLSQGFGGVVCNVSFDHYLTSPEHWAQFERAVKAAKKVGMSMWLYDEKGYPSGTAGGLTMKGHPEYEAEGLLIATREVEVPAGGTEAVSLDLPPGKLVLAAAYPCDPEGRIADPPKGTDLSARVSGGKLAWKAPAGRWHVLVMTDDKLFEGTHVSISLGDRIPYINLLMPEATARFIDLTHGAYVEHLGDDLGKYFVSTFTDEPSLMSDFLRPMPYSVLPWSPGFAAEFKRLRGYDLTPHLADLVANAGPAGEKVRYDFWHTVGDLVSQNFFGQIQDYCRQHDILSGGHLLLEESLLGHVPLYGDFFQCLRRLDAPSIDCLTSLPPQVPWYIARLVGSAADLDGDDTTMCETSDHVQMYRPAGDTRPVRQVTEAEIRGTCNRLMLGGINTITSYYRFVGQTGASLRRLNDWVGRCCTMLKGGRQVADIALLYPIESIWPHYQPSKSGTSGNPRGARIEELFKAATNSLYESRRDFTYIDARTLAEAKVEGGRLVHKTGLAWRVVVLPGADTLPMAAWDNLAEFWRQGGVVIAIGALPANSESKFPSAKVQKLAREVFGKGEESRVATNAAGGAGIYLAPGSEALLPSVLGAVLQPDLKASEAESPVRYTHRRIDGHEVYFLINDSPAPCDATVSAAVTGAGEVWDPATGKMTPAASGRVVKVTLQPYGAVFLRFAKGRTPRRLKIEAGGLPGMRVEALPAVEPTTGKGEFVDAEMGPDKANSKPGSPVWRAVGTLTKAKVDTFLMLVYPYPQGVDLKGAQALAIDTWVPKGQQTPAQLVVILQEADGGQYMAVTSRGLVAPGKRRIYVPLSAFEPGPSGKDPNGRLDLGDIKAIICGWGGYYGKEGERVEFSAGLPMAGRLAK